jgi:hypothetical protein
MKQAFEELGDFTFTIGTSIGLFLYFAFIKPKYTQNIIDKIQGK